MAKHHPNADINEAIEYALSLGCRSVQRSCPRPIVVPARSTGRLPLLGVVDAATTREAFAMVAKED